MTGTGAPDIAGSSPAPGAGDPPAASGNWRFNLASKFKPAENPADLSRHVAVWHALRSKPIDFYPRVAQANGKPNTSLGSKAIVSEFVDASGHWPRIADEDLETAIELARQSLDEAKEQTEYQDQKATRLLTVTTFLTALSGVLFTRYNDRYALNALWDAHWLQVALVLTGYALFGLFLLASLGGALVTFHATRTRFKYPDREKVSRDDGDPTSRLFYQGMLSVRPSAWAAAFVPDPPTTSATPMTVSQRKLAEAIKPRADLQQCYFRDLVGEAYLVSAKAADKLRYLEPAQGLLSLSLKLLFVWLIMLPIIALSVPAQHKAEPSKITRLIVPNPLPVSAKVTELPPPPAPPPTASPTPLSAPPATLPAEGRAQVAPGARGQVGVQGAKAETPKAGAAGKRDGQ